MKTAEQAADTAKRILNLFEHDRQRIETLGRASSSALRVYQLLQGKPILSIQAAAKNLKLSVPTVTTSINNLQRIGILKEMTGRQRKRLFLYHRYLEILNEGTEPLQNHSFRTTSTFSYSYTYSYSYSFLFFS